jgi:hypothetical protein
MDATTTYVSPSKSLVWGGYVLSIFAGLFLSTVVILGPFLGAIPVLIAAALLALGAVVSHSIWSALGLVTGIGIFTVTASATFGFDAGSAAWFVVGTTLAVVPAVACAKGIRRHPSQPVSA